MTCQRSWDVRIQDFKEVEDEHAFRQLLEMILKYLEESWSLVEAGTDKQTRDLFRAFFTKEILILLKLRYAGEKVGGQAEPNCQAVVSKTKPLQDQAGRLLRSL